MASSASASTGKKLIQIDVVSDTVCPWCYVGKKNLDKALASSEDKYDFKINWHPFILNPSASKEGVVKREYIKQKLGPRALQMEAHMAEIFRGYGLNYDMDGLTGNTLDSHRLLIFAGKQGHDKQHKLAEELGRGYFTEGKFIGDRGFLVESAKKVGVEGAAEFLDDPNNGLKEVYEEIRKYASNLTGVPYYIINGKHELNGGQQPESFLRTFKAAAV
ncbi:hypothetical protein M569_03178 [Genlisea aurea]|uniref:DSBA-like thioredoxin domain-containing protein n=1 Tax=Genlisea aurea TaxID=192259 RepID=S8CXB4_9LAMI|nr:hypothetical protein M569_03178 [Genlisea aurea]